MSAAPSDKSAEATAPLPAASPPPAAPGAPTPQATQPPSNPRGRVFLAVSGALLLVWFAWLSYTALTKSREPIVSRAQAAVAQLPVVATVKADEKGAPGITVVVDEPLKQTGPRAGVKLVVSDLPAARGFTGEGKYLLLLSAEPHTLTPEGTPVFHLLGSRGLATESDPPTIYKWSPDVEVQARRLYRGKD